MDFIAKILLPRWVSLEYFNSIFEMQHRRAILEVLNGKNEICCWDLRSPYV